MSRLHYLIYVSILLISFPLVLIDKPFSDFLHFGLKPWDAWLQVFTSLGDGWFLIPACLFLTACYLVFKKTFRPPLLPILAIVNFLISGAVVQILKFITSRPRPYLADDTSLQHLDFNSFHWLVNSSDYRSFPSGHAAAVFSILWMVSFYLPLSSFKRFAVLSVAVFISMTRVALGKHFLADVIAGSSIAMITGVVVINLLLKSKTLKPLLQPAGRTLR